MPATFSTNTGLAPSDWICSFVALRTSVAETCAPRAPRGGDRLQAGDADAHHEHLGRRDGARGGHHHRERAAVVVRPRRARPCSPARFDWLDSTSIDCARVMRGMNSIASASSPAFA
jgi:hypothetical protein